MKAFQTLIFLLAALQDRAADAQNKTCVGVDGRKINVNKCSLTAGGQEAVLLDQKEETTKASPTVGAQQSVTHPGVLTFVSPILVTTTFIVSVALVFYCKKRRFAQQKSPPLKTVHDHAPQEIPVYEEITEGSQNFQKAEPSDSTTVYCLASMPQNTTEGNTAEYYIVQIPNSAPPPSNSTPLDHVISNLEYSEVQFSSNDSPSISSSSCASDSAALVGENAASCTDAAPAALYPDLSTDQ